MELPLVKAVPVDRLLNVNERKYLWRRHLPYCVIPPNDYCCCCLVYLKGHELKSSVVKYSPVVFSEESNKKKQNLLVSVCVHVVESVKRIRPWTGVVATEWNIGIVAAWRVSAQGNKNAMHRRQPFSPRDRNNEKKETTLYSICAFLKRTSTSAHVFLSFSSSHESVPHV
jgi:hypothetical protein